ncbi:putative WLM domain containing protein [Trypanosoma cruzi]|nr:putative WLM domain containing protein [Trypanosoma cruzi]
MTSLADTLTRYSTIGAATTLGWAGDEYAREYMQRLLVRAHAILSAHNWKIRHLKEFYPRSARLLGLNVNRGDEVCVRFRAPSAKNTFLPFTDVICTMLHELAHCRYSRHDKYFWGLYSQLVTECEQLEVGIACGKIVGTASQQFRFTGSHRLGGSGPSLHPNCLTSMRKILADAALKRIQLSRFGEFDGCGCDDAVTSSSTAMGNDGWICKRCGNVNMSVLTVCDFCSDILDPIGTEEGWDCTRCSFHNYCNLQHCEACSYPRSNTPDSSQCAVQRIKVFGAQTGNLSAHGLLGRLADVLDPILRERGWQVICLNEFSPTTLTVMSQGEFIDSRRAVLRVRLRSPNTPSEFLSFAYVCTAALHQLAHMVERHHGVAFFEVWASMLNCCLMTEKVQEDVVMSEDIKGSLLQFTRRLETILEDQRGGGKRPLTMTSMHSLVADCGNVVKRERSSEEDGMTGNIHHGCVDSFRNWVCSGCGFLNSIGAFLYCEVCGTTRLPCTPSLEKRRGSLEAIVITDDDDDEKEGYSSCDSEDVVVVAV